MLFVDDEMTKCFINIQKILKPEICIEIGAHEAYFSNAMSNITNKSFAFEASPYVYENFKNTMLDNVEYLNLAVSDKSGKESFEIQTEKSTLVGNNSIKIKNDNTKKDYISVDSTSLNDFFLNKQFNTASMWIDCEGANKEVLTGSDKILDKVKSIFIEVELIEIWKNQWLFDDVYSFLKIHNFEIVLRKNQYNGQDNIIFVNKKFVEPSIIKKYFRKNMQI